MASGIFQSTHEAPEFLFILEGELVRAGRRMGPGWASVAGAGTIDEDVYSETGCVFVLVDHASDRFGGRCAVREGVL